MARKRWGLVVVVALFSVLMACEPTGVESTPTTSSSATPVPSSPTPTLTPTSNSQDVEQAKAMYRELDALEWEYITQHNGLGADEPAPAAFGRLLTGDALQSEIEYLRRWRSQGWKVVSGKIETPWLRDLGNAVSHGSSVVVIQACQDSSRVISSNATEARIPNHASVVTVFFERVGGELRISYFDQTKVEAVAPCGPSASPTP